MTAKQIESIRNSAVARWTALGIVAFTMLAAYFFTDVMSPLKTLLETEMGWDSSDYGFFTSAYGWFNVFLFMLLLGGLILDKMGVRFTGQLSASLMIIGAVIKYWGISSDALVGKELFGISAPVMWASIGYAIYAIGAEVTGITVTKIIVKWFKGKEMALAMGLQVALARVGTALALIITVPFAKYFQQVPAPVLLGVVLLCIGLVAFIGYTFMDRRLDKETSQDQSSEPEESFKLSDVKVILSNKGFWLIALLCVLFYSCVFPFLKYATDLMVNKFNVDIKLAGIIPGLLPFGTILLTPLFGGIYDKKGKGASIMILGAVILLLVHVIFTIPFLNNWILAVALMIILGISFSLVPSAMWPSVAKIIPEKQLGTAYALIFWIQNIGLMGVPFAVGKVLDAFCKVEKPDGSIGYDYTLVMFLFSILAALSILVAVALKREDKKKGYGLELKNVAD
ncbi:MAG: Major Facilitator Superfamily protein [Bacteroidetes bacterium ADurb.Bin416]|jgi:MFS family permease|nr:MAG: Major Facilitator Superfamily protein [Bacteroidetes bacterium ADurb.Bin416]